MIKSRRALMLTLALLVTAPILLPVFSGCTEPVAENGQSEASFDPSSYEIRELPIANGAPIGRLSDGSLVIALLSRRNPDYPMGVYLIDPETGHPAAVFRIDTPRKLFEAVLTGDILVWVETDEGMIMADWQLWARNLVTGRQWEIDHGRLEPDKTPVVNPTLFAPPISTSGNLLLWTAFEPGGPAGTRDVLRLHNLETGEGEVLDQVDDIDLSNLGVCGVSGDYVVYNPGRIEPDKQARYGKIVLLNLKSRERKVLEEGYRVASPSIRGRYVVWASGEYSIKLYDIETGAVRTVVTWGGSGVWSPTVNEKVVVWHHGGSEVFVVPTTLNQTSTGSSSAISLGQATGGGRIDGPFLYWHARQPGGGVVTRYIDFSEEK